MFLRKQKKPSADGSGIFVIKEGDIHDSHLKRRTESALIDSFQADGDRIPGEIAVTRKSEFLGTSVSYQRLNVALLFSLFILSMLLFRLAWLQIMSGSRYVALAEGNRIRIETIKARRGLIYDRSGELLVRNVPQFSIDVIPGDLPQSQGRREALAEISSAAKIALPDLEEKLAKESRRSYQPVLIRDGIPYEEAIALKVRELEIPSLTVASDARREYVFLSQSHGGKSLSHVLGYTGRINREEYKAGKGYLPNDYIGKSGVELSYEGALKGEDGSREIEVDALGNEKKVLSEKLPVAGQNLVLSIDLGLQRATEGALQEELRRRGSARGSAIAMDPRNGEVLALVSLPAFDNNLFARGISEDEYRNLVEDRNKPLFFRAISGEYPSGSVFKLVVAAAALEEGIINEKTSFLSTGGLRIGSWFFPDWRAGGHGITNLNKAIADSVNIFFYIVGGGYQSVGGLGVDRLRAWGERFGLNAALGIDLPAEASGFLPAKDWKEKTKGESWYIGDTYHLSIGQGDLLVTPLQVAAYTAAFANGGTLLRPHVLKESFRTESSERRRYEPSIIRENMASSGHIEAVRQGMRAAVTQGSAHSLASIPQKSAGKTGTAEWGTDKKPHAWFTGFAPYDDPRIVVTVLIEEGEEGSVAAIPVAREMLRYFFEEYEAGLPKDPVIRS